MYQTPEQLIALNKSNLEAAMRLAGITLQSVEKLFGLQIATAKAALAHGASNVRTLSQAKDSKDLVALRDHIVQPSLESAQTFARGVYDVAASTQTEFSKVVEAQIADFNKTVTAAIDNAAKNAPSGAQFAVSALRTAVAGANVAFDNMSNVAKQAARMAEANVAAATQPAAGRKKAA